MIKFLEVRDKATFIPVIAVLVVVEDERSFQLMRAVGWSPIDCSDGLVMVSRIVNGEGKMTSYDWPNRTMSTAHGYIADTFHGLQNGDVIDVEFILGETTEKKTPQAEVV